MIKISAWSAPMADLRPRESRSRRRHEQARLGESECSEEVGAAPALWIRTWDMGTAVVMIAVQPTYGERAYWSSRVLAPTKDGLWQMKESYHNYIAASGVMTEVQGE